MYTASFKLRCLPFEDRADVAFFYPAAEHEEAIAAMQYEAQHGSGIGLILGETGTGKTISIRALSRRLTESDKVVVLTVPGNGAVDVLREACKGFGVSLPSSLQDVRGLARLRRHLSRSTREGSRPILIIDQAEHLSPGDLNDIESLLELQGNRGRLLRIVLAAHPRFRSLLEQPAFGRLRQLAFTEHRLGSLSERETAEYIRHRLDVAGAANSEIFSDDAMAAVFEKSRGIPRVINQACSAAMLAAYGEGETRVTQTHVLGTPQQAFAARKEPIITSTGEFEPAPTGDPFKRLASAIWDEQYQNDDVAAVDHESRLTTLIQKAERLAEGLKRRIPQAADAADQAEGKVEQMLGDARERILTLESRLSAASRRAEQAASQVERAEQAFTRAELMETRLTAFAEQLAEQMDSMQTRVAEIMKYASPLDDARNRLEGVIQQSESACGNIEESVERAKARILEQSQTLQKDMQRSLTDLLESSSQEMRSSLEGLQKEGANLVEKYGRSIKSLSQECHQDVTQKVKAAQEQIEVAGRAATDKIVLIDQKTTQLSDAIQAGEKAILSAVQQAKKTAEDLKQAGELARQEGHNAHDAADRIRTLQLESTQVVARLGADTAAARQAGESVGGLVSSADAKISQLASTQAAVTHLHERMGRMLLTAHPLVERADEVIGQLDERLVQSDKSRTLLGEKVMEIAAHVERANQAGSRAAQEIKNLQGATQTAARIFQKLETTHDQSTRDIASLQEYLAKSSGWLTRMESFSTTVAAAGQTSEQLSAVVASGVALAGEIPTLLESTRQQQAALVQISESMKGFVEIHDQARRDSQEASRQMGGHLQMFHESLHKSEGDLTEYQRRVDTLESEFQQVTDRANAAQRVAAQVQSVVENAQSQSENLERVCVAVRKVFSGLSQASLNARNQAQELEQFVTEANHTASTFQHWLERVRGRLDDIREIRADRPIGGRTHASEAGSGILEREAEMLVDDEPGAANAHLVEGGLDAAHTQTYPSQAREIAQLIEKARKSKTGDAELELAVQPVR